MGVLSVAPSSGRFLGGGTKRGRLWVGKWAFVGWRRGVSSEAITEVATEVIDLRPAPAELLDGVTERLCGFGGRSDR